MLVAGILAWRRVPFPVVVVAAADRETALSTAREELATGAFTVPPQQCTDDVHTEIWTIRELH